MTFHVICLVQCNTGLQVRFLLELEAFMILMDSVLFYMPKQLCFASRE